MSSQRIFIGLVGVCIILFCSTGGVVYAANIILQKKAARLIDIKLEQKLIEEQQSALYSANKDIAKYTELDKVAQSIVPRDKDQAKAVRDIISIANDNGISIDAITFAASNLGVKTIAPTTPPATDTTKKDAVPIPVTPVAPAIPKITQAKPVDGVSGVYSLQIDVIPSVDKPITYKQLIGFLERLENNRRTAQISRINITPKNDKLSFSLSVNIFIKP